jgi:hypothetical protein
MNEKWECFLCCKEDDIETLPYGYLSNSHPLCNACADAVLNDENHIQRFRLSYHKEIGDIIIAFNIPLQTGYAIRN